MKGRLQIVFQVCSWAALSLIPLTAVAVPFQNGGFELPSAPSGFFDISVLNPPTGWVAGGTLGSAALFGESTGNFGVTAFDGVNLVGFGGNGRTGATLSQTFDTVNGIVYTVTYHTAAQQLGSGPQSYSLDALDGATPLGTQSSSIPEDSAWVLHTFAFTATGSSSTIRFTDTSDAAAAFNDNWALDAVSVSVGEGTAGTPEPATLSLISLGLLAMVGARRRSQS